MRITVVPILTEPSFLAEFPVDEFTRFLPRTVCPACFCQPPFAVIASLGGTQPGAGLALVICDECQHVFYDRNADEVWLAEYYSKTWDRMGRERPEEEAAEAHPEGLFSHFLSLHVPKEARILDFGCGFGGGVRALYEMGWHNVVGLEPSAHRARVARKYSGAKVVEGELKDLAEVVQEDGPFDFVISRHVFEHLSHPRDVLRELRAVLSSTGRVLVLTPIVMGESIVNSVLFWPHLQTFNEASMAKMFRGSGYSAFSFRSAQPNELVVLGSVDPSYRPESAAFERIDEHSPRLSTEAIVGFLRRPWLSVSAGRSMKLVAYTAPSRTPGNPLGLAEIEGFAAIAVRIVYWAFGWSRGPSRLRALQRTCKASRIILGKKGIPWNNIIGIKAQYSDVRPEAPWIAGSNGELQILVK